MKAKTHGLILLHGIPKIYEGENMRPINLKITIKLLTPFHVGGIPGEDANVSYILRDADQKAYYPGTAFKGKTRHFASLYQKETCLFPAQCSCRICRLFGGEGNARGSLIFSDLNPNEVMDAYYRTGNTLDPYRRVAEDGKLFSIESDASRELIGHITGTANDDDVAFLIKSIKQIQQIGGNTSRGLGWIDGEIDVTEEPIFPKKANDPIVSKKIAKCVSIKVIPKSPLLIGTHTTESNFRDTKLTIPGSVIRAALARAICEQDGNKSIDSEDENGSYILPVEGVTNFPNLRKVFSELRFNELTPKVQSEPYPMSMRKCKNNSSHKKVDILAAMLNKSFDMKCEDCNDRLAKIDAYEDFTDAESATITVTSMHSGIDKYRGTAKDELLFSIRALAPNTGINGVEFCGNITGDVDLDELNILCRTPLHIGAMITKGFGECDVVFNEISIPDDNKMQDRIIKFNELIHKDKKIINDVFHDAPLLVPITLMSDAIVDIAEPKDGKYLEAYSSIIKPFKLIHIITKHRYTRGYDTRGSKEKRKDVRLVMQAGSVLVLQVDNLDVATIDMLKKIEAEGIGSETNDGYGAIRVAYFRHFEDALKN